MAYKFTSSLLLIAAVAAVSLAEPARFRGRSSRLQFARQEQAPEDQAVPADPAVDLAPTPASAPYPPAGVTPEVPFDLPTETEAQPDLTYGPPAEPDNTYGPPDNTYGPPAEPDNTYGPPAGDAPVDLAPLDAAEPVPASLIQPRNGRFRSLRPVPEKLRSAQIIRSRPVLVYTI
ncbi:proline-rich extensin-like protein EPR1 [Drosophila rhopaloa]|uniref:Proline-rich extensin-like protein EPR1 n=1 Tax=Drosophila rhopaloa TaxID=1041015 RepID=A0A6P4FT52_DRORH|nr:proline-rich extensin-like protein EPR1 [Drosophila rhopaloa]